MSRLVFPPCYLTWSQTMVEVMETMATSFKRSRAHPQRCRRPLLTHASSRDAWTLIGKSGSVSCGVTAPFSWVLVHTRFCLCPQESVSPVLCTFWWFYDGINGDHLQEGLCHTQVYCTQSPCPCSSPLLTCTSSGDTQTQFCLCLCGVSGSWYTNHEKGWVHLDRMSLVRRVSPDLNLRTNYRGNK